MSPNETTGYLTLSFEVGRHSSEWRTKGARRWHSWDRIEADLTQHAREWWGDHVTITVVRDRDREDGVVAETPRQVGDRLRQPIQVIVSWDDDEMGDWPEDWEHWSNVLIEAILPGKVWTGKVKWEYRIGFTEDPTFTHDGDAIAEADDPDLC